VPSDCKSSSHASQVICAPGEGDWNGNDKVLMVLPERNTKKGIFQNRIMHTIFFLSQYSLLDVHVYFDYIELSQKIHVQYKLVDTNTILFKTPPCPLTPNYRNRAIPIRITQNGKIVGQVNFIYNLRESGDFKLRKYIYIFL
jgi:hypothetical protein